MADDILKPVRDPHLAALATLPDNLQDEALCPWKTVALICNAKDLPTLRKKFKEAKVPLVRVNSRTALPRLKHVHAYNKNREVVS